MPWKERAREIERDAVRFKSRQPEEAWTSIDREQQGRQEAPAELVVGPPGRAGRLERQRIDEDGPAIQKLALQESVWVNLGSD